jgi:hypothetical protein
MAKVGPFIVTDPPKTLVNQGGKINPGLLIRGQIDPGQSPVGNHVMGIGPVKDIANRVQSALLTGADGVPPFFGFQGITNGIYFRYNQVFRGIVYFHAISPFIVYQIFVKIQ